jgi:hypothetical protein
MSTRPNPWGGFVIPQRSVVVSLDGEEVDRLSLLEERQMLPGQLALTIAALFTGAAIYINIAEQPARLQLDDSSLLAEWKLAYSRGYMMQASFAIAGGFFGVVAFFSTFEWRWLLGAAVLLVNWPYTMFVMMPTNRRLMNTPAGGATTETRSMIGRWGILHAGRSVLGLAATLIFLWAQR